MSFGSARPASFICDHPKLLRVLHFTQKSYDRRCGRIALGCTFSQQVMLAAVAVL